MMFAHSAIFRKSREVYLSVEHCHHTSGCEYTTFAVVESNEKNSSRRSSRQRRHLYSQYEFTPKERCSHVRPAFYIALHKQRFHVVISECDDEAAQDLQRIIRAEEQSRRLLESVRADMAALNSMSIKDRVEHELQYREAEDSLRSRAKTCSTFTSFHWSGSKNCIGLHDRQSFSPCLLCKFGIHHAVRVLRLDLDTQGHGSRAKVSFTDQQVKMLVSVPNVV
jgi:hypothetical protein